MRRHTFFFRARRVTEQIFFPGEGVTSRSDREGGERPMEEASKESAPRKTAFLDVTGAYEQERYVRLPRLYGAVVAGVFALSCFVAIAIGIPLMQVMHPRLFQLFFFFERLVRSGRSGRSVGPVGSVIRSDCAD